MLPRAIAVALSTALLLVAGGSFAQERPRLGLALEGACPSAEQVLEALAPLLRGYQLVLGRAPQVAHIQDLGETYRVSVDGASREVVDPSRSCGERARVVAVFLLLSLSESPATAEELVTPPPATPAPALPMPVPRAPLPAKLARSVALRSFVRAEVAPGAGLSATSFGLGASLRRGAWGLSLLGGFSTPMHPGQEDGAPSRLKWRRFPCSLLAGWERGTGLFGVGLEAGPTFDILHFEGEEVPHASVGTRLNVGLGLHARLRLRASQRWQADLGPTLSYFPRTYVARVDPAQVLSETPRWWAGLSLGLRYSFWER